MGGHCASETHNNDDLVSGAGVIASDEALSVQNMMDKTFLGFSIKLWILLILVVLVVGHKKQMMPWNEPAPAVYYW
jgi:hypothetical protein